MDFQVSVQTEHGARVLSDDGPTEILVGERVRFALVPSYLPCSIAVTTAPAGATPLVDGDALIVDRPGAYAVTLRMGTASKVSRAVAFPREALDDPRLVNIRPGSGSCETVRTPTQRRLVLRSMVRCPDLAGRFEGLTPECPLPLGLNVALYGG